MSSALFGVSRRPVLAALVAVIVVLSCSGIAWAAAAVEVVVVVSAVSPVTEISRHYLADIYLGRTSRFPDGEPVEPIDQEPGSQVRTAFYANYLGRSPAQVKAHWSKLIFTGRGTPPPHAHTSRAVKELIAGNPRAIGYLERSRVDATVRVVRVR